MTHLSVTFLLLALTLSAITMAAPPPRGKVTLPPNDPRHKADHQLVLPIPHIYDLRADFFDKYIRPPRTRRYRYWVVVFYTHWCSVCDDLVDPLMQLGDRLAHRKADLTIAKHNVDPDTGVAQKYGLESFPTIILFDKENDAQGVPKVKPFEGPERTVEALGEWIKKETGIDLNDPLSPDAKQRREERKRDKEKEKRSKSKSVIP